MQNNSKIFRLKGVVQHYAWGGKEYIPALLHDPNRDGKPYAEYWMGAHDNATAEIYRPDGRTEKLNEVIKRETIEILGEKVFKTFGRMPYLLKILDVKDMLSIQVHPDKRSAEKEYEEENKKGIPLNAPTRNYKDSNHKPELMLALSDFWLLHGFKPKKLLSAVLEKTPELHFLLEIFQNHGYERMYRTVMEMPQPEVNNVLQPLLDRIIPLYKQNALSKEGENFWAARAALTYNSPGTIDRGIFSIYFFNVVHCKPGEAVFQDAGVPHAYLEGQNVEIMSNSDNVLRGGLTPKHIDVTELMKHIKFEGMIPDIIHGKKRGPVEEVYETPAPDFELSRFELKEGGTASFNSSTADILFVQKGGLKVADGQSLMDLTSGEAAIVCNNAEVKLQSHTETTLYRATAPVNLQ